MSLALCYWILLLIYVVFGAWSAWPNVRTGGGSLIVFLLLLVIGWKVFGAPLHS